MKQPDAFERAVEKVKWGNDLDGYFMRPPEITRLLRRQHAKIERMVQRLSHAHNDETSTSYDSGYLCACRDILEQLQAMRRGK